MTEKELREKLNEDIVFEKEKNIDAPKVRPKLNMNRILDLISSHYHSEEEWNRQLIGFVDSIKDKDIRENLKQKITFDLEYKRFNPFRLNVNGR